MSGSSPYSQITILNEVSQCSYPPNLKDYLTNIIYEMTSIYKSCRFMKINKQTGNASDVLLVIRLSILAQFGRNTFDIPILIYLPKKFPYEDPEVFVERTSKDLGINTKNRNIDPQTFRIMTKGLSVWNSYSSIQNIVVEVNNSFNENFPVFQMQGGNTQNVNRGNSPKDGYVHQNINVQQQNMNIQPQNINVQPRHQTIPHQYTSDPLTAIRLILIDDIKRSTSKYLIEETHRLNQETNALMNYKQNFQIQTKKYQDYLNRLSDDSENAPETPVEQILKLIKEVNSELETAKKAYQDSKSCTINENNSFSFTTSLNKTEDYIVHLISIEASMEDISSIVKKAFERNLVNFSETVKFIRLTSREIIKVRCVREREFAKLS